jgi:hypothetical protein
MTALGDGAGTSSEIAAETGLPLKHCCAYLRALWQSGELRRELHRRPGVRSAFVYHLLALLFFAGTALAADPPESSGGAVWVATDGDADRGVAYPVTRWRSLTNRAYFMSLDALVGTESVGLGVSREIFAEVGEGGRRRSIAFGLAAVVPYSGDGGVEDAKVGVYGVLRVGRRSAGQSPPAASPADSSGRDRHQRPGPPSGTAGTRGRAPRSGLAEHSSESPRDGLPSTGACGGRAGCSSSKGAGCRARGVVPVNRLGLGLACAFQGPRRGQRRSLPYNDQPAGPTPGLALPAFAFPPSQFALGQRGQTLCLPAPLDTTTNGRLPDVTGSQLDCILSGRSLL